MSQSKISYNPSIEDQVNVCMAFLSYIGEKLRQNEHTAQIIYKDINEAVLQLPTLLDGNSADWRIVWGQPSIPIHRLWTKTVACLSCSRSLILIAM